MKKVLISVLAMLAFSTLSIPAFCSGPTVSDATDDCLACHTEATPGIVADWKNSLHAAVTPAEGMGKKEVARRMSADTVPENLKNTVVGCAECHTMNPGKHEDTFEHNGYSVHVVVSPGDCATCHPVEVTEYDKNLMANAYGNLMSNPVYHDLADKINGIQSFSDMKTTLVKEGDETFADSCLFCHGTVVSVKGMRKRDTVMGEMELPVLSGWPNQGVGRINPDGTKGACSPCHTRHQFSSEMARKPSTCSTCHKGPDVPAYKVYSVSKHGNIYDSLSKNWNFTNIPWVAGRDFTAPTCAVCHISLLATEDGEIVVKRTHQMSDRLPWRLFGLVYAHPHPESPDTTIMKNAQGLPLPTELTGEPVSRFLIDEEEMVKRRKEMDNVCSQCHSYGWVEGHSAKLENTIRTTNEMTLTATKVLLEAWKKGTARGLDKNDSIFNEEIEKMWVRQWLFYANSTRFAAAMNGADYGVFANGRWFMAENIQMMKDWLEFKLKSK